MNPLANLKVGSKIFSVLMIVSLTALIIGIIGFVGIRNVNNSVQTIYNDRVVCLKQIKVIADMYAVNIVDTCHKVRNGNLSWEEGVKNIDTASSTINEEWSSYTSTFLTDGEKSLVDEAQILMKNADASVAKVRDLMLKQDQEGLVSQTGDFHPCLLSEPYMKVSPHTAPIIKALVLYPFSSVQRVEADISHTCPANHWLSQLFVLAFCISS